MERDRAAEYQPVVLFDHLNHHPIVIKDEAVAVIFENPNPVPN